MIPMAHLANGIDSCMFRLFLFSQSRSIGIEIEIFIIGNLLHNYIYITNCKRETREFKKKKR